MYDHTEMSRIGLPSFIVSLEFSAVRAYLGSRMEHNFRKVQSAT